MLRLEACRVCGGIFLASPLLEFPDSPDSAQGFLDRPVEEGHVIDLKIHQCGYCGLVQHDLPPVPYFRDVIRAVAFSEEMRFFRQRQLGEWIEKYSLKDKRILELGCGKGEYLNLLRQAGAREVFGIEYSKENLLAARQQGFQVQAGYMAPGFVNPWSRAFDAFAVFSFMEHWPDLTGSLRALHAFLNEDAYGLVEVPNFEFVVANGLYSEFTTDHIFYFDRNTLRSVLENNGFEVLSVDSIWHDYILSAEVQRRRPIDSAGFMSRQRVIIEQITAFVGQFDREEVVVWGAGHQALAVISMAKLQNKIAYVVDSAPFKQNKYTPGTNILIKAPENLARDVPQAVVIMAAAYSNEVARIVATEYPQIEQVAILREDHLEVIEHGT